MIILRAAGLSSTIVVGYYLANMGPRTCDVSSSDITLFEPQETVRETRRESCRCSMFLFLFPVFVDARGGGASFGLLYDNSHSTHTQRLSTLQRHIYFRIGFAAIRHKYNLDRILLIIIMHQDDRPATIL